MRKVLIFALTIALALGGLGFAHAAVTDSQDELLIYPTLQIGNAAVLDGRSAEITLNCGAHLLWHSSYAFGGGTETAFDYSLEGHPQPQDSVQNSMELGLSGGMSASTNGSFSVSSRGYGDLFRAVAAQTAANDSRSMNLKLADYVEYYIPEFSLSYREQNRRCFYTVNFMDTLENRDWYNQDGVYEAFLEAFRFPVQPDHIVSVGVSKDDAGRINSIDYYAENGPELSFISHVASEGIWFIPIFRDFFGNPLSYESPEGHGIYFVPWKVLYTYDTQVDVAPDMTQLRRLIPLDEQLSIDCIIIDGEKNECRMLTREEGRYFLSAWDLTTGAQTLRLDVLPHDPAASGTGHFEEDEGFLLVTAQGRLALVDPDRGQVLLTAPDVAGQRYAASFHDPSSGDLRFADGRLYLLNPGLYYQDGAFWTAVWQEGECLFYGEYDCSLMRGNDNWYYNSISVDSYPLKWK